MASRPAAAAAAAAAEGSAATSGEKEISYGATFKAYTDSGETHFNTYLDALRELVDNSAQYALSGNTDPGENPDIQIVISVKGRPEEHLVAVGDNGRGMKEEHLVDFLQCVPNRCVRVCLRARLTACHRRPGTSRRRRTAGSRHRQAARQRTRTMTSASTGLAPRRRCASLSRSLEPLPRRPSLLAGRRRRVAAHPRANAVHLGALQVFYLGDGVDVITKHRDEDCVRRISMSKVRDLQHETPDWPINSIADSGNAVRRACRRATSSAPWMAFARKRC